MNGLKCSAGKEGIVCFEGTGEVTSTGKGSHGEEEDKCHSSRYACVNGDSS